VDNLTGLRGNDGRQAKGENMLIAPAFLWLWIKTGNTAYRDIFDQAFSGIVQASERDDSTNSGFDPFVSRKAFCQKYIWSFDAVAWRQSGVIT
jgi:hypothetical protein